MKKGFFLLALAAALVALGFGSQEALAEGAVTGVVIDADGEPVAGAHVMLMAAERQRGERHFRVRGETNENGVFGFRQVPEGRYMIVAMAREVGAAREMIGVRDDEVTRVQLQLQGREREEPGRGTVGGTVIDPDGEPVVGAWVALVPVQRNQRRGFRARGHRIQTDRSGVFVFENVPEGEYVVMAWARGIGRARDRVEVIADQAVRVQLQLRGRGE